MTCDRVGVGLPVAASFRMGPLQVSPASIRGGMRRHGNKRPGDIRGCLLGGIDVFKFQQSSLSGVLTTKRVVVFLKRKENSWVPKQNVHLEMQSADDNQLALHHLVTNPEYARAFTSHRCQRWKAGLSDRSSSTPQPSVKTCRSPPSQTISSKEYVHTYCSS